MLEDPRHGLARARSRPGGGGGTEEDQGGGSGNGKGNGDGDGDGDGDDNEDGESPGEEELAHGKGDVPYPLFVIASGLHRRLGMQEFQSCSKCPYSLCSECVSSQSTHSEKTFRRVPSRLFENGEIVEDFIVRDKKVSLCLLSIMFTCMNRNHCNQQTTIMDHCQM